MNRILIAVAIAVGVYAFAVGTGALLYATGTIATGATHNDCGELKREIADRDFHGDLEEVPQEQLKEETIACLAEHELTAREAFRSEYLFWALWPGIITALVFLAWPVWTRVLENQEAAEGLEGAEVRHRAPESGG